MPQAYGTAGTAVGGGAALLPLAHAKADTSPKDATIAAIVLTGFPLIDDNKQPYIYKSFVFYYCVVVFLAIFA